MPKVKFIFQAEERETEVPLGYTVLQAAAESGVPVEGNCGGNGTCGRCRVKILSGSGGDPTPGERRQFSGDKLSDGWALACQRQVKDGMVVEVRDPGDILLRSKANLGHIGLGAAADLPVEKVFVELEPGF